MSYSGAIPLDPDHSDSAILIDACLARIHRQATTGQPVLPPLKALLRADARAPSAHVAPAPLVVLKEESPKVARSEVSTAKRARLSERSSDAPVRRSRARWPVILCGFIGGVFGGAALMKSPVGHRPEVQHVVKSAQTHVENAYASVAAAAKARLDR
jgi:hypothetical protein